MPLQGWNSDCRNWTVSSVRLQTQAPKPLNDWGSLYGNSRNASPLWRVSSIARKPAPLDTAIDEAIVRYKETVTGPYSHASRVPEPRKETRPVAQAGPVPRSAIA